MESMWKETEGFKVAFTLRVKYGLAHRPVRTSPAECSAAEYDKLQRMAAEWVHGTCSECLIYLRFSEDAQVICRSAILHAEREGYLDAPLRGSSRAGRRSRRSRSDR